MYPRIDLGFIQIPTFYLVISLSLVLLLSFLSYRLKNNRTYDGRLAFDLALIIMFSSFIGARLFHIIYEAPLYYWDHPGQALLFWNGGYVYFGGFLLAFLMSFIYLRYKKESYLRWADFFTPLISLGYALGRMGCFFEGCCYGRYCELPWAIQQRHPTQLYMVLAELILFFFIVKKKPSVQKAGKIFYFWLSIHSATRFLIEFFRADDRGLIWGDILSISQILSLTIFCLSILLLKNIQNSSTN